MSSRRLQFPAGDTIATWQQFGITEAQLQAEPHLARIVGQVDSIPDPAARAALYTLAHNLCTLACAAGGVGVIALQLASVFQIVDRDQVFATAKAVQEANHADHH